MSSTMGVAVVRWGCERNSGCRATALRVAARIETSSGCNALAFFHITGASGYCCRGLRVVDVGMLALPGSWLPVRGWTGFCGWRDASGGAGWGGEWREGTSPSRSLRTVRDSLPSYGSHSPAFFCLGRSVGSSPEGLTSTRP